MAQAFALCNDAKLVDGWAKGEPTEAAIVNRAIENNIDKYKLYKVYKRILDIPFDSNRKMMSTIHKNGNEYLVITKGAPDVLLSRCKYFNENGRELLSRIKKANPRLPVITSVKKFKDTNTNKTYNRMLDIDMLATDIYTMACKNDCIAGLDYTRNMVMI